MPTEELKQALRSANVTNAERDLADVLAKMFDVPRELIYRVMYALLHAYGAPTRRIGKIDFSEHLPSDLRKAIAEQVDQGYRRTVLRQAVEKSLTAAVWIDSLVNESDYSRVCVGCPKSLECVMESLSTPEKCATGEGPIPKRMEVRPVKIHGNKVTVECDWPRGKYVLDVKDFDV